MPPIVASVLLVFTFVITSSPAQTQQTTGNDKYAPLPDKVAKAKTVFYVNDTGNSRFGDDLYKELKKWNHWQVLTDRSKTDLVLVLSQRETVEGVIATGAATGTGNTATGAAVAAPIKT